MQCKRIFGYESKPMKSSIQSAAAIMREVQNLRAFKRLRGGVFLLCVARFHPRFLFSTHVSGIDGIRHDSNPAFESSNLKEWDVGVSNMVKSDWRVNPFGVVLAQACPDIGDNLSTHLLAGYCIHTLTTTTKINTRFSHVSSVSNRRLEKKE